ncbi:iron-sulfur cluster assembly scaffold protein [Candidatus Bathyarchaeota archaeon]|nr:iron-sulfur cluster assembly scaffold protein [Candidatus Bathyarchaeota archaeon]
MTTKILESKKLLASGFSDKAIELCIQEVNVGVIDNYDASAVFLGSEGDLIRLYIKLNGDKVEASKFLCYGHPASSAAMSALTILLKDKSLDAAKKLTIDDILKVLGGLPDTEIQFIELAIKTLNKALLTHEKNKNSPKTPFLNNR